VSIEKWALILMGVAALFLFVTMVFERDWLPASFFALVTLFAAWNLRGLHSHSQVEPPG
jgi:hypothetical protein